MNGLTNAAKYGGSQEDGAVALHARVLASGELEIEVLDHGPGLRGRTLAELCNEFSELPTRDPDEVGAVRVKPGPALAQPQPQQVPVSSFNTVRGASGVMWDV